MKQVLLNQFRKVRRFIKAIFGCDVFYVAQIKCQKEHHGTEYGGWVICPIGLKKDAVVYSFGLGEDISFDLSLIKKYGLKIYGFDPTPRSIQWVKSQDLPQEFVLFETGLANYDGAAFFRPPHNPEDISCTLLERPATEDKKIEVKVNRLKTTADSLGHKKIDILKIDIEGAEYGVIPDILGSGIDICQLLLEFHHGMDDITVSQTKEAVDLLNRHGYRIFHVSPTGKEYSFIKNRTSDDQRS